MKSGSWFAIETLMSVAAIGALFIGATAEAAMVLLLFLIGERTEGWAASRARKGVSALMALKPETATRLRDGVREEVAINTLRPGDIIEVAAGGVYPPTVNWFPVSPALMKARSPASLSRWSAQRATKSRQARPALTVSSPRRCYLNRRQRD